MRNNPLVFLPFRKKPWLATRSNLDSLSLSPLTSPLCKDLLMGKGEGEEGGRLKGSHPPHHHHDCGRFEDGRPTTFFEDCNSLLFGTVDVGNPQVNFTVVLGSSKDCSGYLDNSKLSSSAPDQRKSVYCSKLLAIQLFRSSTVL